MKRTVIKNIPTKLPISSTLLYIFLMDYYNSPGWFWGVVLTVLSLLWAIIIYVKCNETTIDIFDESAIQKPIPPGSQKFRERLREMEENRQTK